MNVSLSEKKLCHNLLYYMNRSFVDITTLFDLHISFFSFNWNQPVRPVDRRPEVGWDRVIKAFRGGHMRFFVFQIFTKNEEMTEAKPPPLIWHCFMKSWCYKI